MPIKTLYHGTNTKRLEKIKKEGLDPKALKASSGDNFVYLTDNPEVAAEFSGFGTDRQGVPHEGYMTPLEGKKKNGVVLKVKVDSSWLKPDKIWGDKLKQLKNRDRMIADLTEEIKGDINGNQVLEFYADEEAHRLAQEEIKNNPDDFTDDDIEWLTQDRYDEASHTVAEREATKIVDGQLAELKKFAKGKLYQCAKRIPPEAIVEVIPAKKFLPKTESGSRNFGNDEIEVMGFLVRAVDSGQELIKAFEALMQDFAKTFEGYGLEKIEDQMQKQIKKQLALHGIKPASIFYGQGWQSSVSATEETLPKKYLNKKEWNQHAFKTNYKNWIQKYITELKKLKQKFSWLDIDALVKPLLEIKWDQVRIHAESGSGWEIIKWSGKTLYHGSVKEVKKFDVSKGSGRYGKGLYLTPDLKIAQFYAAGGRQGKAGQRIKEGAGFVYEFKVSGDVFRITDEYEAMVDMAGDHEPAEQAQSDIGDYLSSHVTKHTADWVREKYNCDIVWFDEQNAGVLSPLNQVLILNQSAIKSMKPMVPKKKKSAVSFLAKVRA